MSQYEGRLELTWTNKHKRLLAHEDGSYQWVTPSDHRVSEVRLLRNVGTVGEVAPDEYRARDNLLIQGDALNALRSLNELPEFGREYVGKVKLAYLDPPFNTQQSFLHYDDNLEHSVWLTMMRDRLMQIKTLLSREGSAWVHCDESEQAYLKVMMDEVFGRDRFVATIVWQRSYTRENRTDISTSHDYILVYAVNRRIWSAARNLLSPTEEQRGRYSNPDDDPRGPWKALPAHAQGGHGTPSQFYTLRLPSGRELDPPPGNCWRYTLDRFNELVSENRVWFGRDGNGVPAIKRFWSEVQTGLVPVTIWLHDEVGTTGTAKNEMLSLFPDEEPFATPKPEALLERIIQIGSNPGDVILDCFLGSSTTAAVAHKMGRRWIGVEREAATIDTYAVPRLTKVVSGEDPGGITEAVGWHGGGGFRILEVVPSMFIELGGQIFLDTWATDQRLAEATTAQLGYDYCPDPPFCGIKGRSRLAVIDGLVNAGVIELLVRALAPDERLTVCGTALDDQASEVLRKECPGSIARKIPQSILAEYRLPSRRRQRSIFETELEAEVPYLVATDDGDA